MRRAQQRSADRFRRVVLAVAQSSVLVAFAFVQAPRWIAPDTKLDLYVDPTGLLQRALSLWDPNGAAGQLQNQAYGYLFPMGPFFVAGDALGLQPWLTQRLWWALLLLLGFHGTLLVLRRLGVGTPGSRLVAAYAYALAPRMLEGLGAVSSEIWPMAVAPWVLAPLVAVLPGRERVAAARSATALLAVGAVNAVATLAVLVLPAWWVLTRRAGHRWRVLRWWVPFVAMASFWWAVPLVLLGRYSPAFLDWIESSAVTTTGASLTEALRGTTQWIAAFVGSRGPQWPAAWRVLTEQAVVLLGLALAAIGLLGLARAPRGWRRFGQGGLLIGLLLVTVGRVAAGTSPVAPTFAALLDGPLAPFRNTHKFEPVVRLVLCLGVAHALPVLRRWLRAKGGAVPAIGTAVAVMAIVGQAVYPALQGVSQRGAFLDVPGYWKQAATWLAQHDDPGRTLVLPGAMSAASYWGDPRDEPLQPLADSPWMVRDAVPLGSAGATRLLNDVEARVASGYGGPELRNALVRLGVSRVLVRSDLDWRAMDAPDPMTVRAALASAGARTEAVFGPDFGGSLDPGLAIEAGIDQPTRAIAVYSLPATTTVAPPTTTAASDVAVVSGGPEGTVLLEDARRPTVLLSDPQAAALPEGTGGVVLTDSLQRRQASFGVVRNNYGPVLAPDEDYTAPRRVHDWLMPWLPEGRGLARHQTVAELRGVEEVGASTSLAQPAFGQRLDTGRAPVSAFDASADTAWESAGQQPEGQWVSVRFDSPVSVPDTLTAVFDMAGGADIAAVTVRTDRGTVRTPISSPSVAGEDAERYAVPLRVRAGPTRSLRLTVEEVRPGRPTVRVRDLGAGVVPRAETWLRLPSAGGRTVDEVHLQASPARTPRCVPDAWTVLHCSPGRARPAEGETDLRRTFALPEATEVEVEGTVYPASTAEAARLLRRFDDIVARSSSTWMPGPAVSPGLVLDGDPRTYWAAEPGEERPTLVVSWPRERQFTGLRLTTWASVTGRRPTEVVVTVGSESFRRPVGADGVVDLPDLAGRRVEVQVTEATSLEMTLGAFTRGPAPVVVGELELVGADAWGHAGSGPGSGVEVPCGFGPSLEVNGRAHPTQVTGTKADLVRGQPLRLRACGKVSLAAGTQRVRLQASVEFGVRSLSMVRPTAPTRGAVAAAVTPSVWGPTDRALRVADTEGAALLSVRENANAGWTATARGRALAPVTVDGWSQGWLLPAGAPATVRLWFSPQQPFLLALLGGALLAVVVLGAALAPVGSVRGRRPAPEAVWPAWLATISAGSALFLLAGVPALVAGVAALGLRRLRAGRWSLGVAAAVAVAWVGWAASRPWPAEAATNRDAVSQMVVGLLLALVVTGPRVSPGRAPGSGARRRSWRAPTSAPVPPRHASSPPRQGASPRS